MGIGDFLEEAAGGLAAEQIADKLDPNAGILVKGAAALAGFEGVGMVKEHLEGEQAAPALTTRALRICRSRTISRTANLLRAGRPGVGASLRPAG